jgi:hypothetical protein
MAAFPGLLGLRREVVLSSPIGAAELLLARMIRPTQLLSRAVDGQDEVGPVGMAIADALGGQPDRLHRDTHRYAMGVSRCGSSFRAWGLGLVWSLAFGIWRFVAGWQWLGSSRGIPHAGGGASAQQPAERVRPHPPPGLAAGAGLSPRDPNTDGTRLAEGVSHSGHVRASCPDDALILSSNSKRCWQPSQQYSYSGILQSPET